MTETMVVQDLSVAFKQSNDLLMIMEGVNFELSPGETVALLGESGCGKSITSLALMRLLPFNSLYGRDSRVRYGGCDLLDLPEEMMRELRGRQLAMIFQEPMTALNPVLTIGQQLAESLTKDRSLPSHQLQERMVELLTEVEISEPIYRLDQYPHQLSGGQKQRVMIAMALAGRPDVLIADEPTTALDTTTQAQILELLKCLQAQYQMSILLVTHDLSVVKSVADRVCVMYAGQIVEVSPVTDFITAPKHPYAQQLLVSLPSFSKRKERLQAIPGCVPALEERPSGCRFHPRCAHGFDPCSTIEPQLQLISDQRIVRCHLYPEHQTLPSLPEVKTPWVNPVEQKEQVLSVCDLSVYFYPRRRLFSRKLPPFRVVEKLSFTLCKGKTLALVGESGCGKTTVSKAIMRLQPMTSGKILYRNDSIETFHGDALRRFRKKVQIVFQDPFSSMNPRMTIAEILSEGMWAQGFKSSVIQSRLLELLNHVNLPKTSLNRYPHQFSGGQRQRICIARALATNPEVLICDEPTSALDISVQAQILNLLKSLQYELGLSYLFITHNMRVVSYIADDVLVMRRGEMVEFGTCEQVLTHPQKEYTAALCGDLMSSCPKN